MPSTCCVPGCRGNYSGGGPKVSTYKFPKDEIQRKKWILAICRKNFVITEHSRVCELHFKESDFEKEISAFDSKTGKTLTAPLSVKRLKKGVVPSLCILSTTSNSSSCSNRETPDNKRSRIEKEQLNTALKKSLSASGENSPTKDSTEISSESRSSKNEVSNSAKRKGTKRKGIADDVESVSKAVNGFTGISYSVLPSSPESMCTNSSNLGNQSTLTMQDVQIKQEQPWEEEYNYVADTSNSDTVKITNVQSCADIPEEACSSEMVNATDVNPVRSDENEKEVLSQKEAACKGGIYDKLFYAKPMNIDKRDENFGRHVACGMSDLRSKPELYLKTKRKILDLLVQAEFEAMCANNAV